MFWCSAALVIGEIQMQPAMRGENGKTEDTEELVGMWAHLEGSYFTTISENDLPESSELNRGKPRAPVLLLVCSHQMCTAGRRKRVPGCPRQLYF